MNNFLIVSYWRHGSNLLSYEISRKNNSFYIDDFFQQTKSRPVLIDLFDQGKISLDVLLNIESKMHTNLNKYLSNLLKRPQSVTMKLMYSDCAVIEKNNLALFNQKVFLYRSDIFHAIISFAVAQKTKSWAVRDPLITAGFTGDIDKNVVFDMCNFFVRSFYLLKESMAEEYDSVINYESDLVPYAAAKKTFLLKQPEFTVNNIAELRLIYNDIVAPKVNEINAFYSYLKHKNKIPANEWLQINA